MQAADIVVGNHTLLPNTPNQVITIRVRGGDSIAGEDFFAQIGDGGTFVGGIDVGPIFTSVDIIGSSIFAGNHTGAYGDPSGIPPGNNSHHPLIWVDGTIAETGTVAADGLLATLTIDTSGLTSGTFPLVLTGVATALGPFSTTLRDANGDPISLTVTNGTLTISALPGGDFNHDGVVDAADYVVWREGLGTSYTPADYDIWRANFGQTSAGGAGVSGVAAVPEPATWLPLLSFVIGKCVWRRRASGGNSRLHRD